MSKIVIGANGKAQTGKDTTGQYLVEQHGFTRISFADAVRQAALGANPIIIVTPDDLIRLEAKGVDTEELLVDFIGYDESELNYFIRLKQIVEALGWELAKEIDEVRTTLQRQGTEAGRDVHGQDCWLRIARRKAEGLEKVVFTDVRFPNEAEFVRQLPFERAFTLRVSRDSAAKVAEHSSEQILPTELIDYEIDNNGKFEDLWRRLDELV